MKTEVLNCSLFAKVTASSAEIRVETSFKIPENDAQVNRTVKSQPDQRFTVVFVLAGSRFFSFLLIVVTLGMTSAQIPGFGDCPRVKVVQPFKLQRYLGLWYEVKKYPFIFTLGGKCVTAEYGLNSNGTVSVYNQQTRNGKVDSISGLATIKNVDVATLGVTFPNVPCELRGIFH